MTAPPVPAEDGVDPPSETGAGSSATSTDALATATGKSTVVGSATFATTDALLLETAAGGVALPRGRGFATATVAEAAEVALPAFCAGALAVCAGAAACAAASVSANPPGPRCDEAKNPAAVPAEVGAPREISFARLATMALTVKLPPNTPEAHRLVAFRGPTWMPATTPPLSDISLLHSRQSEICRWGDETAWKSMLGKVCPTPGTFSRAAHIVAAAETDRPSAAARSAPLLSDKAPTAGRAVP